MISRFQDLNKCYIYYRDKCREYKFNTYILKIFIYLITNKKKG